MLTPAWTALKPHSLQSQAWRSKARFICLVAGRGSGKTELSRRRIVRMLPIKKPWPNPIYFYALPTYKQAKRVAWRPILNLIPPEWVKGRVNESELRVDTVFGSSLYIVGMDKPQRIEGDQWDGGIIDESCDQKPGGFTRSVVPALSHRNGWCWRIGVPKRVGVGATEFKDFWKKGLTRTDPDIESFTWPSSDILSDEQLRFARANLDERDYNEQYNATWETLGGRVFYAFSGADAGEDSTNVRNVEYDREKPIIVGSDFNVDPMAWIIAQEHIENGIKQLHVFDEIWIRNTNTRETLDRLSARYGSHESGFDFFGDATGRARNTRASESDYVQIKNDKRFRNARIWYPKGNPSRHNRFAACNAMFRNADGNRRCFISPKCVNLIRDLEYRAYKENSSEPDDSGDIGHITDALGYVIHKMFPLVYRTGIAPTVYITENVA